MSEYNTIAGFGRAEISIKRSRFIGSADFVTEEEDAIAFIQRIRTEFPDAKHNVYAYLLRNGSKTRYSDDKEPQGTAGMPILEVLKKNAISDAVVVVTRYFGGILLGTGGLARAYTEAACDALTAATRVLRRRAKVYSFQCPYSDYERACRLLEGAGASPTAPIFGAEVTLTYTVPSPLADSVFSMIYEEFNGRIAPDFVDEDWQNTTI